MNPAAKPFAALACAAAVSGAPAAAPAQDAAPADFLAAGQPIFDLLYRYEYVDRKNLAETARANTVRARAGYRTGDLHGLSALLEVESSMHIGDDRFNDTINGKTRHPTVADPESTALNRAWLNLSALPDTDIRAGRHLIKYDNLRFVGNAGWRQNEQTFDGVRVINRGIPGLVANYAWITRAHRIFGKDHPQGEHENDSHLFNLRYEGFDFGKITGYAYLLDMKERAARSSKTFGALLSGAADVGGGVKFLYSAEAATQSPWADNPGDYSVNFFLVEPGFSMGGLTVKGTMEYLEGEGGSARFLTPLASLHGRQGWADVFAGTGGAPPNGIRDVYATVSYRISDPGLFEGAALTAVYHDYAATNGGARYGSEIDLVASVPIHDGVKASVKFARYRDDEYGAPSRSKFWVSVGYVY